MYFLSLPVCGTLKIFARFARVINVSPPEILMWKSLCLGLYICSKRFNGELLGLLVNVEVCHLSIVGGWYRLNTLEMRKLGENMGQF